MTSWTIFGSIGSRLFDYIIRCSDSAQDTAEPATPALENDEQASTSCMPLHPPEALEEQKSETNSATEANSLANITLQPSSLAPKRAVREQNSSELLAAQQCIDLVKTATRCEFLIHQCQHMQTDSDQIQAQNRDLKAQHTRLQADNNSLKDEIGMLQVENDKMQAMNGKLKYECNKLEQELTTTQGHNEELQAEVARLCEDKQHLARECMELRRAQEGEARHIAAYAAREEEYKQQLLQLNLSIYAMQKQIDGAAARESAHKQLKLTDEGIFLQKNKEQISVILRLRNDITIRDEQLVALQEDMAKEAQRWKSLLSDSQSALASLQEEHEQLKSRVTFNNAASTARRTTETDDLDSDTSSVIGILSSGSNSDTQYPPKSRVQPPPAFGMLRPLVKHVNHYECKITAGYRAAQRVKGEQFNKTGK